MQFYSLSQKLFCLQGSSFVSPAYGWSGTRATMNFISPPAEKNRAKPEKQKGKKEGGWGEGIFALLRLRIERFRFSLIKRKPKQKIFHLLLKEKKWGAEKNKKCNEKISVLVCRSGAEASGNAPIELPVFSERKISFRATTRSARGQSGFCSKKVRISTKRYRQFTISEFSEVLRTCGAVAPPAGGTERADFATICHAPRGEKEMF